jgi:RNA polymerase sigma-70 factor (ECF subfamily)
VTSPDVAADAELAEGLSMAMLTVVETLGAAERAVFVLREVFETPYDEIAEAVGKSPAAVCQIAHRARDHVAARRPRMPVSSTEHQEAVDRFLVAIRHGDLEGLLESSFPTSSPSVTAAAWPPLLVVPSGVRNGWPAC